MPKLESWPAWTTLVHDENLWPDPKMSCLRVSAGFLLAAAVRTLACHPLLAKAAIDYAKAFVVGMLRGNCQWPASPHSVVVA